MDLIISVENIKNIDLEKLCLNKERLGPLIFEDGFKYSKKIQDLFIENGPIYEIINKLLPNKEQ